MHVRAVTAWLLTESRPASLVLIALWLPVPYLLGQGGSSYVAMFAAVVVLGLGVAALETREHRRTFVDLWMLGLAVRVVALTAIFAVGGAAGGPFLGPDSTTYYALSEALTSPDTTVAVEMTRELGIWNVGHPYVLGFVRRVLGADLFAMQLLACGFTALVGPLTFAWSRFVVPREAALIGLFVTLFPSLITLSTLDLLKDPSVLFCLSLALVALARLSVPAEPRVHALQATTLALALVYLHFTRFYAALFLEMAAIAVVGLGLARVRRGSSAAAGVAAIVLAGVAAEVVPPAIGRATSPALMLQATSHTLDTPEMRDYAPGLADDVVSQVAVAPERRPAADPRPASSSRGEAAPRPAGAPDPKAAPRPGSRPRPSAPAPAAAGGAPPPAETATATTGAQDAAGPPSPSLVRTLTVVGANTVRRVFGPFAWVPPLEWNLEHLLRQDYHMYPGMIVLYFLLPIALTGIVVAFRRLLLEPAESPVLAAATLFLVAYGSLYLVINLSYRHRDMLIPVLAVMVALGLPAFRQARFLRMAYAAYWVMLIGLAGAHLIVRFAVA